MNWDYDHPFTLAVTVQPQHIDALDHTRNTHYVEWCMEAAWAHTSALGLGPEDYRRLDRAMALTHAEYDYLKAIKNSVQSDCQFDHTKRGAEVSTRLRNRLDDFTSQLMCEGLQLGIAQALHI